MTISSLLSLGGVHTEYEVSTLSPVWETQASTWARFTIGPRMVRELGVEHRKTKLEIREMIIKLSDK